MYYSKKLKKIKKIRHCFFSRKNGFSSGLYKELNCGLGSNDDRINVEKNLDYVSKKIGVKNENLFLMHQTHSNKVVFIDEKNKKNKKITADALLTKIEGVAIGVLTADCVPIILYDEVNKIVGCIHAGWKGAASGIIENTLDQFKRINKNAKIIAAIGPCIGKESYEVSQEFYDFFLRESEINKKFFIRKNNNKFLFDIRNYVNKKLSVSEVSYIENINFDTFKDSDNFFSYRRSKKLEQADYGRCISTISLIKN